MAWGLGVSLLFAVAFSFPFMVMCDNIQRGDSMQMTTRSKMWLLGARCLPCRHGGGGSSQEILAFVSMP